MRSEVELKDNNTVFYTLIGETIAQIHLLELYEVMKERHLIKQAS